MTKRSPAAVALLPLITFGIYSLVWFYKTAEEMKEKGAEIPSFIFMFIPGVNLFFIYKWCEGAEKVTNGATTTVVALVLQLLLGPIGSAVVQSKFNEIA